MKYTDSVRLETEAMGSRFFVVAPKSLFPCLGMQWTLIIIWLLRDSSRTGNKTTTSYCKRNFIYI
jgi:hypothetical protein